MWLERWRLTHDPYRRGFDRTVETPPHRAAVAALTTRVEAREPWAVVGGEAGIGKSVALREVLARVRSPKRRVRLGGGGAEIESALKTLRLQGIALVVGLEVRPGDRLRSIAAGSNGGLTLLVAEAEGESDLAHRMRPLTRSEAANYLEAKFRAAGGDSLPFEPRAVARLHAEAAGLPGDLDRLAASCLRLGHELGSAVIGRAVVDEIAADRAGWCGARLVG